VSASGHFPRGLGSEHFVFCERASGVQIPQEQTCGVQNYQQPCQRFETADVPSWDGLEHQRIHYSIPATTAIKLNIFNADGNALFISPLQT
jgi:hypothetical protein